MKQIKLTFILIIFINMMGIKTFAHDIEVANTEGVTIYYTFINDNSELAVVDNNGSSRSYSGNVVIPEYVTYDGKTYRVTLIGGSAFYYCTDLISVTIPNSVTSIGSDAFSNCINLTTITIPNSVTSIGSLAFGHCKSLYSVNIPYGVTSIERATFEGCTNLTSVTIPQGVTTIGYDAFSGCTSLNSLDLPNSVVLIYQNAFKDCSSLKSLVFENGESTLYYNVEYPTSSTKPQWFQNCPIEEIYIGRNMDYSFITTDTNQTRNLSPFRENDNIRIVEFGNGANFIPLDMFYKCSNLECVKISESVREICGGAFYGCKNLLSITIPSSQEIIYYSTFYGCSSLTSISIPNGVKTIQEHAFAGCISLKSIIIEEGKNTLQFERNSSTTYFFSGPVNNIVLGRNIIENNDIFYSATSLFNGITTPFSLTIKKTVTELTGDIFAQCKGITNLIIEDGEEPLIVKSSQKFNYSTNQYYIIMPFYKTSIDNIYLDRTIIAKGESNEDVKMSPFYCVTSEYNLTLGQNIHELANYTFYDGTMSNLIIPNNVKRIGDYCFYNCQKLKNINIEESVENLEIGNENSFQINNLETLHIGRNMSYSFQKSPFTFSKEGLTTLTFGSKVTYINNYLFEGFKTLSNIELPDGLIKIGINAFYGCERLVSLTIPNSVTEIGRQAFDLCRGLKTVNFVDGNDELTFTCEQNYLNNAFANSPLEEVYWGRNINYTNLSPFYAKESLKKITFGNHVTMLKDGTFTGCPNLVEVYSNAEIIPSTGQSVFTESFLSDATLYVPYSLYDEYRVTSPWSLFGSIKNYEGKYNLIYMIDDVEYKRIVMEEGATIIPETQPDGDYLSFEWIDLPQIMPDHDVVVHASYTTGIVDMLISNTQEFRIYSPNGKRLNGLHEGLNILKFSNGTVKKVVVQ